MQMSVDIGNYIIFDDGRVFSYKKERFLKPHRNMFGYPTVKIDGKNIPLHRLLAIHFIPNPDNLETVNHKDKDKWNWALNNLEWCSREDNVKHGLQREYTLISPEGEIVSFVGQAEFCRKMGLTQANISKVIMRQRKHHKGWELYLG